MDREMTVLNPDADIGQLLRERLGVEPSHGVHVAHARMSMVAWRLIQAGIRRVSIPPGMFVLPGIEPPLAVGTVSRTAWDRAKR